jgi:hypothetical protein
MKYFSVKYNGTLVGTFSLYQVLNGFEDFEFALIDLTPYKPCKIEKCVRYMYTMKLRYYMPCYSKTLKR